MTRAVNHAGRPVTARGIGRAGGLSHRVKTGGAGGVSGEETYGMAMPV